MILVSSCLLGLDTKYNGKSNANELILSYCRFGKFIPICPEQLGGLETPRAASEIAGGSGEDVLSETAKVISVKGIDVSKEYIKGAEEIIKLIELFPVTSAILKQRSPSCGSSRIYDGTFSGKLRHGQGVAAALLRKYNIAVYSEEDITTELMEKLMHE